MVIVGFKQQIVIGSKEYKELKQLDAILVHRINIGTRASDVVNAFLGGIPEAAKATGYKMPYHFVIEEDGMVVQCLPLNVQGPHAWKWNSHSIGIANIGDFRRHVPTKAQYQSCALLCKLIATPQNLQILGHDEAKEGSTDPHKQCPGKRWNMDDFRKIISEGLVISESDINDFWRRVQL